MEENKKQRQMKEEIQMYIRKKDYYDILGVSKNCTDADIKKAYKKLALRFHPDKNSVEGAKVVFNKVSQAYSTLTNPEKKADYDRFGPEEDRQPQYRPQHRGHHHPEDEFEDIFRAFFGGVHPHNRNNYTYTFNMGGRRQQRNGNQEARANANDRPSFNFLHIFILISVLYIIPIFFREKPTYSMSRDYEYKTQIQTEIFRVAYFVRPQTLQQFNQNNNYWKKTNEKVETEFLMGLYKDCQLAERRRRNFQLQAYRYGPGQQRQTLLRKARKENMASCRKFSELRESYGDYVRKLLHYY